MLPRLKNQQRRQAIFVDDLAPGLGQAASIWSMFLGLFLVLGYEKTLVGFPLCESV